MKKLPTDELPIRSKKEIAEGVGKIIHYLHTGQRSAADLLIEDLKVRSIYLSEDIQRDVLIFAEEVQFQYAYDPWHKVTTDVEKAADKLIEDLGFFPPAPPLP
ncbi:MAG: hypothetical protein IT584_02645 [Chlamydiae bacterium]|nr:hypothetical protein [Chlamydiota bacterium]